MSNSTKAYDIHYNQYLHNKRFISLGMNNNLEKFYDWEITVTFYAMIHLVEAVLYSQCGVCEIHNHEDRSNSIKDNPKIFSKRFRLLYESLQSMARTARYQGITEVEESDSKNAQRCLEDIELELGSYLNIS